MSAAQSGAGIMFVCSMCVLSCKKTLKLKILCVKPTVDQGDAVVLHSAPILAPHHF